MLFFTVATPIYIPINGVQGFLFLYILTNSCYFDNIKHCLLIIAIPMGVTWYFIVVSICISLIIRDIEWFSWSSDYLPQKNVRVLFVLLSQDSLALQVFLWFLGGTVVKNMPASAGDARDTDSIAGSGRSPGGGHGNPLQYSCLENPVDRGAWWAMVQGVTKSQTWLSN